MYKKIVFFIVFSVFILKPAQPKTDKFLAIDHALLLGQSRYDDACGQKPRIKVKNTDITNDDMKKWLEEVHAAAQNYEPKYVLNCHKIMKAASKDAPSFKIYCCPICALSFSDTLEYSQHFNIDHAPIKK